MIDESEFEHYLGLNAEQFDDEYERVEEAE
jgi:hypothetical protein